MSGALPLELEEQGACLFIHFDVKDHHLSLDTFIQTAESARKVAEALEKTFFMGGFGFEIIVLPPREGTFLQRLGIQPSKKLTVAAVAVGLCTPQGEAFTKGLTGQTTSEWFEAAGVEIRHGIETAIGVMIEGLASVELAEEGGAKKAAEAENEVACNTAVRLITSMTRGILELGNDALDKIGMETGDLPDALEARAEFYEACYYDPEVKRVGFTPEDDFLIPRNSFPERAQKPERKKKDEGEPEWFVSVEGIFVTSPNWDQEDQKARQWKGKDSVRRDCYFVIEDAEFWYRVKRKGLHVEVLDNLKVQWAYQMVGGKAKNRRVLRVLEFNGDKLADPLPPDSINAILGSYSAADASRLGPSLLDFFEE